jgi:hypothetical protein
MMPAPTDDEVPIPHLQRRKIEGRVIEACRERLARELAVATICKLAAEDGGGGTLDLEMLTDDKRRGFNGGAADSGYTSRQADANDG